MDGAEERTSAMLLQLDLCSSREASQTIRKSSRAGRQRLERMSSEASRTRRSHRHTRAAESRAASAAQTS